MSTRQDFYLSSSIQQANMSPLHYRHGCVIVRGGKIIGQGFNTRRPGFESGALKHGNNLKSLNGLPMTNLEEQIQHKKYSKHRSQSNLKPASSGDYLNTPLSMHSEMMAIQSALSLSPDSEASKPMSRPSVPRPRPRQSNQVASSAFKSRILKPIHLNQVKKDGKYNKRDVEDIKDAASWSLKKNGREKRSKKNEHQKEKSLKNNLHKGKQSATHQTQHVVLPDRRVTVKASISARTKDLRLKGADLYVARLGNVNECEHTDSASSDISEVAELIPTSKPPASSLPKSLHDELNQPGSGTSSPPASTPTPRAHPQIRASRPCYRCIMHMHAVGIKRVFWTDADGKWEKAKVRDLMDALEISGSESDGENVGNGGIFVTKHEVLIMRRAMGC